METDMTREEAIEALKKKLDYYESDKRLKAACETLIPELRESEDEKIGNAIEVILSEVPMERFDDEGVDYAKCLAYLEKQKENPQSADSIPSDCTSDVKCENRWHKVGDSLPDNGRLVLANDCLGNTLLARYDGEGNWEVSVYDNEDYYCRNTITKWCEIPSEKQKEQKPDTRDADDLQLLGFIYDLLNEIEWKDNWAMSKDECLRLLTNYSPQKPAEWSDDIIRKAIKEVGLTQHQINWFKNNVFPPKQEWSEEDEKMRQRIIRHIESEYQDWCKDKYGNSEIVSDGKESCRERIAWLKSLRPQPHKEIYQAAKHDLAIRFMSYLDENRPEGKMCLSNSECEDIDKAFKENDWSKIIRYINKYSWKPSEEQINWLKSAVRLSNDKPNIHGTIISLYEQLKRLM